MKKKLIKIWKDDFAVVKAKRTYNNAFANIQDMNEITVIINQDKINEKDILAIEKNWKLITFNAVLDFSLVGFLAKISSALAKEGISIFVISSYSTDHLLVKKKDLGKTLKILEDLEVNLK